MAERKRLPTERAGITHKVTIGGVDVYVNTGEFDDGTLGEIFVTINKAGGQMRVYDALAIAISVGLQHGVPLETFVNKFKHQRMEPSGVTSSQEIPLADSIVDYLAKWLEQIYLPKDLN